MLTRGVLKFMLFLGGQNNNRVSEAELSARASSRVNEPWASEAGSNNAHVGAFPVAPNHMNERMAAHKGVFLCTPSFHARSYAALLSMIIHDERRDRPCVKKLIVGPRQRVEFLKELRRINITAALLFPGLEGFAQSLKDGLEIKMFEEQLAKKSAIPDGLSQFRNVKLPLFPPESEGKLILL